MCQSQPCGPPIEVSVITAPGTSSTITEGGTAQYRISYTLLRPTSGTINLSVSGDAPNNGLSQTAFTVPAGRSVGVTYTFGTEPSIVTVDDCAAGSNKSLVVTASYTDGTTSWANLASNTRAVLDAGGVSVTWSSSNQYQIPEASGVRSFAFNVARASACSMTSGNVGILFSGASSADVQRPNFPVGQYGTWSVNSSGDGALSLRIVNDSIVEGDEGFQIVLYKPDGGVLSTSPLITIVDDDQPTFSVTPDKTVVFEGQSVTFTITTSLPDSSTVYWRVAHDQTSSSDFIATSGSVSVSGGSGSFYVQIANDTVAEPVENFSVNLEYPLGTVVASSASVSIQASDQPPGSCTSGSCSWQWSSGEAGVVLYWDWQSGDCPPSGSGDSCECPPPSTDGTFVGELASTFCEENPLP